MILPLVILCIGISWILASLGVYLRDVAQVVGVATTAMMFMSPIFYPLSALPQQYQLILLFNPLTPAVEQARAVLVWGQLPDFGVLEGAFIVAALEYAGEHEGEASFALSLASAGEISFSAL